jgi:hypothetical protein
MRIKTRIHKAADRALTIAKIRPRLDPLTSFYIPAEKRECLKKQAKPNTVAAEFFANKGRPIDKWHHYLDVYERHLSQYKGKPVFFLEIGVFEGGSLDMWRRYLGDQATIVASISTKHARNV